MRFSYDFVDARFYYWHRLQRNTEVSATFHVKIIKIARFHETIYADELSHPEIRERLSYNPTLHVFLNCKSKTLFKLVNFSGMLVDVKSVHERGIISIACDKTKSSSKVVYPLFWNNRFSIFIAFTVPNVWYEWYYIYLGWKCAAWEWRTIRQEHWGCYS